MADLTAVELARIMLREDEGVRTRPYKCLAGKLTIGVGRNLEDKGLSPDEIEYLFSNDIRECLVDLAKDVPGWNSLSERRRAALINMRFNLGRPRFLKFKRMLAAIKAKDFNRAANEIADSKAARQLPGRYARISYMMRDG